ncbi:TVP38/TMEM64 family protein [Coralliovum pocilloporae]|uniref:TVP38/TMEM64 family protein n=1 Tax=Coralliovum pocilloporae TaxID=3066369 RepID=UPI003306BF7B
MTQQDGALMESGDTSEKQKSPLKRWLPLILIGGLSLFAISQGWHNHLSLTSLAIHRTALLDFVASNFLVALLGYIALYTTLVALSSPVASLATITGGFLFGWLVAGPATVLSATLGASILFLAAKTSLGGALEAKAGPWLQKLSAGFRSEAFSYLLFLRLVPVFPFWLVNLAPAFFNVPLKTYAVATALGIIPGTFAFTYIGVGLGSIIDAQMEASGATPACLEAGTCTLEFNIGSLVTPELLIALAGLGIVAIIPVVLKKLRSNKEAGA